MEQAFINSNDSSREVFYLLRSQTPAGVSQRTKGLFHQALVDVRGIRRIYNPSLMQQVCSWCAHQRKGGICTSTLAYRRLTPLGTQFISLIISLLYCKDLQTMFSYAEKTPGTTPLKPSEHIWTCKKNKLCLFFFFFLELYWLVIWHNLLKKYFCCLIWEVLLFISGERPAPSTLCHCKILQ